MGERNVKNEVLQVSDQLAYTFFKNKVFELAYKQSLISLALEPLNPSLLFNSARCAYYTNRYDEAINNIKVAMLLDPNKIQDYQRELALYLPWIGESDEALKILKELPQDHRTKFNLGWYELKDNNIYEGFQNLEYGRAIKCWGSDIQLPIPKWTGDDIKGKKLLVVNEGGVGDEIIFSRFILNLKNKGVDVSVVCSKGLESIYKRHGINVDIVDNYKYYDYWVPSMSFPYIMKIYMIPGVPYLTPDPSYVNKWKDQIVSDKLKIGVRWQGGKLYEHDQRRTIDIDYLNEKFKDINATFYSLQKDSDKQCPENFIDLEDKLETWEDTLAVISLMDVVVTSCTSIPHISGALGKKTFVITPVVPYFTWAMNGRDTFWYSSVTVFRQLNGNSWIEPIDEVIYEIKKLQ